MPDLVRFSDLKDSHPASIDGTNDLLALAHPDTNSETGYVSFTVSPNDLGKHAVADMTFANLKTGNKGVEGAINQTLSNFAEDFNATAGSVYALNDVVLYNGLLKKCINPSGTTSGTFIDADWETVKASELGSGGGGAGWTDLTATLLAGATSLTIQNSAITANSTIQVFENVGAFSDLVAPTDIVTITGQVVITFPAQSSDLSVKVRVS